MAAPENKGVPSEEGKETKAKTEAPKNEEVVETPVEETKVEKSKSAVEKVKDAPKKEEKKVELEREYVIPLRRKTLNVQQYRRAKRAVKEVKEFLAKHMKVENRNLDLVKIDIHLNNEIWFRGIKKPLAKVKVKAVKRDGVVYAELADEPDYVKFEKAKLAKRAKKVEVKKPVASKKAKAESVDKDKDGVEDKVDEAEKEKASVEAGLEKQKVDAKEAKHTTKADHEKKKAPVRKALKK